MDKQRSGLKVGIVARPMVGRPGRAQLCLLIGRMLANERWQDGPGGGKRPEERREDRDEARRMEAEMDRIWRGDV